MLLLVLLGGALAAGAGLQRSSRVEQVRHLLWQANLWLLSPPLVVWAVATLRLGHDVEGRAIVAVLIASWCMVAVAGAYAYVVARSRAERGALWLGAGFENSGYFGYPAAQLLYGHTGLKLAVVYGQSALGVPAMIVTTTIASIHGAATGHQRASLRRVAFSNPLLACFALGLALRAAPGTHAALASVGGVCAALVGPLGFLLFGLALPLGALRLAASSTVRALGAMSVRFVLGPLILASVALLLGARLPAVFLLLIASPTAMHVMTLSRIYRVEPELMRAIVVGSSLAGCLIVGTLRLVG